jgi:hypothetical protein
LAWRRWGDKLIGLSIDLEELHSASRTLEARVDEVMAGNQELQSYVQRLDSGLVDEDQEAPRRVELSDRGQSAQQDPRLRRSAARALRSSCVSISKTLVRTAGATIRAIRPDVHRVPRSASERPGGHWS